LIHHPLSIIIPSPNSGKNGKKNSIEAELSFWIFLTAKFTLSFRWNFSMSCVEQKFPTRQSTIQNNPFGLRIPEILEVCAFFSLLFWSFLNIFTKKWFGNIVLTSRGQNWYFLDREIRGRNFRKNFGQVWNDFLLLLCQGLRFCQNFLQVFPPNNFEFFFMYLLMAFYRSMSTFLY